MKKFAALLLTGTLLVGGGAVFLTGGSTADPMLSQSYVTGTYIPAAVKQAGERVDVATQKTYDSAVARLKAQADLYLAKAGALKGGEGYALTFSERRFKRGDVITVDTGSEVMLLAGSAALNYDRGAVVDVAAGTVAPSGAGLTPRSRYLAAEGTLCRVTVTSDTAVLAPKGYYALTPSDETDYNQLAGALKTMGLVKGSGTAYGSGYDLEQTTTRIEGLVLFLRLIGEEKAALAYEGKNPFTDVAPWAVPYAAYAYGKGYIKGVDDQAKYFDSTRVITAGEYLTLVLRALGYRDSGENPEFTWNTAMEKAKDFGVITPGEKTMLESKPFLRAQMIYASYYTLSANRRAGGTLQSYLISTGALSLSQVNAAHAQVDGKRIS